MWNRKFDCVFTDDKKANTGEACVRKGVYKEQVTGGWGGGGVAKGVEI